MLPLFRGFFLRVPIVFSKIGHVFNMGNAAVSQANLRGVAKEEH